MLSLRNYTVESNINFISARLISWNFIIELNGSNCLFFSVLVTVPGCPAVNPAIGCPTCRTGARCESIIDSCDCIPPDSGLCSAGNECVDTIRGPECQACDEPECYTQGCKISKSIYRMLSSTLLNGWLDLRCYSN